MADSGIGHRQRDSYPPDYKVHTFPKLGSTLSIGQVPGFTITLRPMRPESFLRGVGAQKEFS